MNNNFPLECTMCRDNNRLEVYYGLQDLTGVEYGTCTLSEEKIQEIRKAKYEDVQKILENIPVIWKA